MNNNYEYASFWIWDTNNVESTSFSRLKTLTDEGWEVVGKFMKMEQVNQHTGLWMLRKIAAIQSQTDTNEMLPKAA
jgi:hypothetical protein